MALDCQLDDDLIAEGLAREVVNRIQKTRKDLNFNVSDRISISYRGSEKILKAISSHSEYIAKETLCESLQISNEQSYDHDFAIDDESLNMTIKKN